MEQRELLWRTPRATLILGSTQKWPHGPRACTELGPREGLSTYRSASAQGDPGGVVNSRHPPMRLEAPRE
eukprot:7241048-Alexandrium_andersonii.AAC.1